MSRRMGWMLCSALFVASSSGCGLLCDRYCERTHDRCDRLRNNCAPPPVTGCYPAPAPNNCYSQPGVYTAQPTNPYCP